MNPTEFTKRCQDISGYDAIVVKVRTDLYRRFCFTDSCLRTGSSRLLKGTYGASDQDYVAKEGAKVLRLTEVEFINYRQKKVRLLNAIKDFI